MKPGSVGGQRGKETYYVMVCWTTGTSLNRRASPEKGRRARTKKGSGEGNLARISFHVEFSVERKAKSASRVRGKTPGTFHSHSTFC